MKYFYNCYRDYLLPHEIRRYSGTGRLFCAMVILLAAVAARAQSPSATSEGWPCVQRYQPEVSVGTFWSSELPEHGKRDDAPQAWELADRITERAVTLEQAREKTLKFLNAQSEGDLQRTANHLVFALHHLINYKRGQVIEGITRFSARQQLMLKRMEKQAREIEMLKAKENPDVAKFEDLQARQTWDVRVFDERSALTDHLCEQPVLMEQKLFAVGRDIAAYLGERGKSKSR